MELISKPSRVAWLGNYVPRQCGIATFTRDLCEAIALEYPETHCLVGAVNDRNESYHYPERVRFEFHEKDINSYRRAADFLNINNVELLNVQHEFGIYGGPAGSHLLALLRDVRMPLVTTLHTVLSDPTPEQRWVMAELIRLSDRLVVMAQHGAHLLSEVYGVSSDKVDIIPHGIPDMPFVDPSFYKDQFGVEGKTVLLTFGLLSPNKGIEYVIEALPSILEQHPEVVYIVLGATHPNLLAREGEIYRLSLERLAEARGVKQNVIFYNRFVTTEELRAFMGAADIYITPYMQANQITSGTLAYAFGAGKAVISTPYWHAQELLNNNDCGQLVPFRDAPAIATAVLELMQGPCRLPSSRKAAYLIGREMIWPMVAQRYMESFCLARKRHTQPARKAFADKTLDKEKTELPPFKLDHLFRMTDDTGLLQHATYTVPNYREGYCTDDNARAYILTVFLEELGVGTSTRTVDTLAARYLAFLNYAFERDSGRFRNFMTYSRQWVDGAGSEDSHGRALWALGTALGRSRNDGHRKLCSGLIEQGLVGVDKFTSPRAWAFTLLAIHEYLRRYSGDRVANALRDSLTQRLTELFRTVSQPEWPWFENSATYDNPRIPQALILSGYWTSQPEVLEIGLTSLRWLATIQTGPNGHFRPIGCNGFLNCNEPPAEFDQQPLEAQAMVSACLEAFRVTKDPFWSTEARRAFEWFLGRNDMGQPLYDISTGGCRDALHQDRLNENEGAESTLAFHLALAEMKLSENVMDQTLR
jgi:glycosyltransferase involved in cell wall biosynthesis